MGPLELVLRYHFRKKIEKFYEKVFNFYETLGIPYFRLKNTIPSVENCIKCKMTHSQTSKKCKNAVFGGYCGMTMMTKGAVSIYL